VIGLPKINALATSSKDVRPRGILGAFQPLSPGENIA
jgi:hypothetical protein